MSQLVIGTVGSPEFLSGPFERRQVLVDRVRASAIDHFFIADHVSFHVGLGMDGLINAATLAAMAPEMKVLIGVYLLALRHPVPVARQLSSLSQSAPGRIVLGVGVGGEDRHEMEICGVDPARRGAHTNHSLRALQGLLSGESTSYSCDFFEYQDALIKPAPRPRIPVVIGGRADAAIRRAAILGDGWLSVWSSPGRFAQVLAQIDEIAEAERTELPEWQHGLQVWTGYGTTEAEARANVGGRMEEMYRMPFERFEKYSPYGTPEAVAEFLGGYVEQGARILNVMPCAPSEEAGIDAVAEVASLLKKAYPDLS